MSDTREVVDKLTKELVDKGQLIEAGWVVLKLTAIDKTARPVQLEDMRMAFFAGAQHLLGSIMSLLESGDDVTPADLRRIDAIQRELDRFIAEFAQRHRPPGQA